jgi:cyanophycin synthetase
MVMTQYSPAKFSVPGRMVFRPGCGYGLHQSHLVAEIHGQPGHSAGFEKFVSFFQPMLDETLSDVPDSQDESARVRWLVNSVGTVLRQFKIATVRHVQVGPMAIQAHSAMWKCPVVLPTKTARSTLVALNWLLTMVNQPPRDQAQSEEAYLALQKSLKPFETPSANQWRTIQAAYDTGYPVTPFNGQTVCLGTGVHRRLFASFVTDRTPMLSMNVSQNKFLTARLLRKHGFPGSQNKLVRSLDEALLAAKEMGYPLVIKPNDKDRGVGVAADLLHEADLAAAYQEASQLSQQVLVEKHQAGFTHRLTVVNSRVMRVAKHMAFGVTGDGESSVAQLVEANAQLMEEKKRVRRNKTSNSTLDDEALSLLQQCGWTPHFVPAKGQYVKLRRKDNVSAGGTRVTLDMAQDVHPDNIQLALNVVALIGLDFAGVDLITPDIGRSWRELPVTICEINGNPQLVARDDPNMYKHVLAHVMPAPFRVQAQLVVAPLKPSAATLMAMTQRFASESTAALSSAEGVWIGGQFYAGPFANGFEAAHSLAMNARAQKITFVMTVDELLRFGLPVGHLDVLFLPWQSLDGVPPPKRNDYQELLRLVQPHAIKTMYIKGKP